MIDPTEKIRRVELVPPNLEWGTQFEAAAAEINAILGDNCIAIHHIGSTAIPDIYAKLIVDILPVINDLNAVDTLNQNFEKLGYVCRKKWILVINCDTYRHYPTLHYRRNDDNRIILWDRIFS